MTRMCKGACEAGGRHPEAAGLGPPSGRLRSTQSRCCSTAFRRSPLKNRGLPNLSLALLSVLTRAPTRLRVSTICWPWTRGAEGCICGSRVHLAQLWHIHHGQDADKDSVKRSAVGRCRFCRHWMLFQK